MSLKNQESQLFYFRNVSSYLELQQSRQNERHKELVVATSSHELRTPLNGILTMLDLQDSNASPQEKARFLRIAKVSGRLMLSLINDMLDFSTIINNKFTKKLANFDLASAVNEAVDLLRF